MYPIDYVETHLYNDQLLSSLLAATASRELKSGSLYKWRFRWQRRAKDRNLGVGRDIKTVVGGRKMADERVDSEIVTQFMLNTCQLRPRLTKHAVQAALLCAQTATRHPDNDVKADHIPLTTGSVAEFYIEPMLPCVGDIDVMFHLSTFLAIPRGHPQLPAEFHNYVKVHEIIDSHLPGYVYLKVRYLLTYCSEDEKYNYVEYDDGFYYFTSDSPTSRHGPAAQTVFDNPSLLSVDAVQCQHCLSWPPQAAD